VLFFWVFWVEILLPLISFASLLFDFFEGGFVEFNVKNLDSWREGKKKIDFASQQMGALMAVKKRFEKQKPLKGTRIALSLHLTKETANLARTLVAGGAQVAVCAANSFSTQDDVAAALAKEEILVFAWSGESKEERIENIGKVLEFAPNVSVDHGLDLTFAIHSNPKLLSKMIVGTEETKSGAVSLRKLDEAKKLKYPVFAVSESLTKCLFDKYYGTGQNTIDAILRVTNSMLAGKSFVVVGYGACGKGVAQRASGFNAEVVVCEVNAVRALQAKFDGFRVMSLSKAVEFGDIFVTATGAKRVLKKEHFAKMKSAVVLCNAGRFDSEIDVRALKSIAQKFLVVGDGLEEYRMRNGKKIFVVSDGLLAGMISADGHPSEIMSLGFSGQALAIEHGVKNKLKPGVFVLPSELDEEIALLQLDAMGVELNSAKK